MLVLPAVSPSYPYIFGAKSSECVAMLFSIASQKIYNLALAGCTLANTLCSLVAFIMLPLILSLPDMKSCCALALPATSLPKSSSGSVRVTGGEHQMCQYMKS